MTALIITIVLVFALPFMVYKKRKFYYPFDRHKDYIYNMPEGTTHRLSSGKLDLLGVETEGHTVFARVRVVASPMGYLLHPSVRISGDGKDLVQYVEYGSKGYRYINLSGCGGEVCLRGHRLSIPDQEVEVYTFKNIELQDKKILILAPHPDDAEIAAYGLYSKHAERVFIMTISPGENGYFHYKELYAPEERTRQHLRKGELRTLDSITVPLMAGVKPENMIMLGYFNMVLEDMYNEPTKEIPSKKFGTTDVNIFRRLNTNPLADRLKEGSNWLAFKENISIILDHAQPDVIVTPHPHIDSHEDHQYSTIALLEVLREQGETKGELLLYTNHLDNYPYGRLGGVMPLPPSFDDTILYKGLYSHPLTTDDQREKILAFDAMRDLRINTDYRSWKRLIARGLSRMRARALSIEKDYFNMYVRSNELFYTFPIEDAIKGDLYRQLTTPQAGLTPPRPFV